MQEKKQHMHDFYFLDQKISFLIYEKHKHKGNHMKLRVYLAEKEMKIKAFSEILGVHRHYLGQIISGKIKPSKRLAREIERLTDGKVVILEPETETMEEIKKAG